MSLETWLQNGWLKKQATSRDEIKRLLQIVERDLRDSQIEGISADSRFGIAFNAALQSATAALRASGYKTLGRGHHVRTIDSLALTLGASPKLVQKLQLFGRRRNASYYDVSGSISDQDLLQMRELASELKSLVTKWIEEKHPGLRG